MKRSLIRACFNLFETILGRRFMWRFARAMLFFARRDGNDDCDTSGEYLLHSTFAHHYAGSKDNVTIVDVGANTGYWADHLLASCLNSKIESLSYYGFEPSNAVRERLTENLQRFADDVSINISSEAVGNKVGPIQFEQSGGIRGSSRQVQGASGQTLNEVETVNMTTIDKIAESHSLEQIAFVKSDVEGFDLNVIEGAIPLLRAERIDFFQFEYNHTWIETRHYLQDVFRLVEALPYVICRVVPDGLEAYQNWHPGLETYFHSNFLIVRSALVGELKIKQIEFDAQGVAM